MFKYNYKISEDNLEKIVGGSLSSKKLYLSLLSSIIFSPLVNMKDLPPTDYESQKQGSLSEQSPKNKFSKPKKFLVGSSIVTTRALILSVFKDSIFVATNVLRTRELLKEFKMEDIY